MANTSSDILPAWKRAFDLVLAGLALVVAAVPMLAIALAIAIESGRPVILRQRRIGLHGEEFLMWKFRTMPKDTPQMAKTALFEEGAPKITALGRSLRRYSLDELPQLFSVLGGTMSVVGPRPALYTQDDLVALRRDAGVFRVRPGLTGLAQISGREDLTLAEKVALDAEYVEKLSPWLDLSIVLRTGSAVLRSRGTY